MITTNNTGTTWNGPICPTCDTRYLGTHTCTPADLLRAIRRDIDRLAQVIAEADIPRDPTVTCPCRPENGGSGVCGCILGRGTIS